MKRNIYITSEELYSRFSDVLRSMDIQVLQTREIPFRKDNETLHLFILSQEYYEKHKDAIISFSKRKAHQLTLLYYVGDMLDELEYSDFFDFTISEPVNEFALKQAVNYGFQILQHRHEIKYLHNELNTRNSQIQEMSHIGQRLMIEKDLDTLLNLILQKSREVTSADAGSLYLVEEDEEKKEKHLRFKITQNDSVSFGFQEFTMPISRKSISGCVADTGEMLSIEDVYVLPKECEYSFNREFDEKIGYRTKSMLVIPLRNHVDEIIGVLQLINRKHNWNKLLKKKSDFKTNVGPFTRENIEIVTALAGQAAVSLENNFLYRSIERLFEGFVNASITAIESRDPTTSGHSSRVAILTEELAKTVDRINSGPLKNIKFNKDQIKEIRYASLLHDFGKVGVREQVLLKAKKLYPFEMTEVLYRIGFLMKSEEIKNLKKQIQFLLDYGSKNYQLVFHDLENELKAKLEEYDSIMRQVKDINEPTVTEIDFSNLLDDLARRTFYDYNEVEQAILKQDEVKALSIKRGSLDDKERLEIESHVTHTFRFLSKVPWTKDIKNIPEIAYAHHEKLNGDGYPNKLISNKIPIQAKMMTVSDIFDALTAADRPYKKAVPHERALTILRYEVKDNHIDSDLVKIFIEAELFKLVLKKSI